LKIIKRISYSVSEKATECIGLKIVGVSSIFVKLKVLEDNDILNLKAYLNV
jgi:hypothetical protein